ncbi:hypothetical protein Mapa_009767 [Marchantia paleacea]|nr:hypothetical protein Mapa_009767 [Marchantia paleacea]
MQQQQHRIHMDPIYGKFLTLPQQQSPRRSSIGEWQQKQQQHQSLKLQSGEQLLVRNLSLNSQHVQQSKAMTAAGLGESYHKVDPAAAAAAFQVPRPAAYCSTQSTAPRRAQSNVWNQEQQHAQNPGAGRLHLNGHAGLNNKPPSPDSGKPATGLQLVHQLLACAEAVGEDNLDLAKEILARLKGHVLPDPDGNPIQRQTAYLEQALRISESRGHDISRL